MRAYTHTHMPTNTRTNHPTTRAFTRSLSIMLQGPSNASLIEHVRLAHQFRLGVERIRVPEALFQPHMVGADQCGLGEAMAHAVASVRDAMRVREPPMLKNVFLTGGCASIPGLKVCVCVCVCECECVCVCVCVCMSINICVDVRVFLSHTFHPPPTISLSPSPPSLSLSHTLSHSLPLTRTQERVEAELRASQPFQASISVTVAAQPHLDAWRGGARWAATDSFASALVTRAEYAEYGPDYLHEHAASNVFVRPMHDPEHKHHAHAQAHASTHAQGYTQGAGMGHAHAAPMQATTVHPGTH
jgi:hypothetical protein